MISNRFASRHQGFTLVEGVLASGLTVVLIGCLIVVLIQFQRGFSQGEEAAVVLNEAGCFLSFLRYDLVNAVGPTDSDRTDWRRYLRVTRDSISFNIFSDTAGSMQPIEYVFESSPTGGTILRAQGPNRRILVDHHIASLTWQLETDVATSPEIASGYRQLWLSIHMSTFGHTKFNGRTKEVPISTKIFPTRLHRQLNTFVNGYDISEPVR